MLKVRYLGVDIIEAGFPISSPGDFNSVVEISKIVKNASVCGLTRAVKKDIEVAADSLKKLTNREFILELEHQIHIKYKFKSNRKDILERAVAAVKYAKNLLKISNFMLRMLVDR